jgi:hemoglobin/transferrin/lactoferrin receptor protein
LQPEIPLELEPLKVTATLMGISPEEAPYSLQVLTSGQMQERSVRSLPEALADLPGVMIQKTANGQGSPYLRGFTGYRTLALIDGVRYNNSVYRDGPNEYFSLIDFHTLDRIELLEGPASVQYGSDAIGGTLLMRTKQTNFMAETPSEIYTHGSQSYRYSSAENSSISRTSAEVGSGSEWGILLGFTLEKFDDVDAAKLDEQRHTGYGQYGIDVRYDLQISERWQLTLNHQDSAQDDVWRTHSTIYAESFSGSEVGTDLRRLKDQARSLSYSKIVGSDLNGTIDEASLTVSFQTWDEDSDRIKSNSSRTLESFDSRMSGVDLQLKSDNPFGQLVYGFDAYRDEVNSARSDCNPDGALDKIRIQGPVGDDSSFSLLGAYLQGNFPLENNTELSAGSRFTRARADIGKFEDPSTGQVASFDDEWNDLSSSLRLSHTLSPDCKIWGGISQSFRAPNLGDLSRYGNSRSNETEIAATSLDPEHFLTYELGIKLTKETFSGSLTTYHTQINDYINSTPTGKNIGGQTEVTKLNSGNGEISGLELEGAWRFGEHWSVKGNITYLKGDLDSYADASSFQIVNEPISRIQPLTLNLALRWDSPNKKWWAEFAGNFADRADRLSNGDKEDTQRIPPGGTPGYTVLGIYGGHIFNEHLCVSFAVENLLDQAYRAHGSGTNEPGLGINTSITASF